MRALLLLALAALLLAATAGALWSQGAATRAPYDDAHLLHLLVSPTRADAVAGSLMGR